MAGVLLNNGQEYFLKVIFTAESSTGNLFLGLMENTTNPALNAQLADAGPSSTIIAEISSNGQGPSPTPVAPTGYSRIQLNRGNGVGEWSRTSQVVTHGQKTFTVGGVVNWLNVAGYFVATSATYRAADAIWAESFPVAQQGDKVPGDTIRITASYEQKDDSE